jgi:hypothetical protein
MVPITLLGMSRAGVVVEADKKAPGAQVKYQHYPGNKYETPKSLLHFFQIWVD